MSQTTTQRVEVIDSAVLAHTLAHPARGRAWSVRELAAVVGASPATIGHLRTGERDTVSLLTALLIAEAVGCHPRVLFTGPALTNLVDSEESS